MTRSPRSELDRLDRDLGELRRKEANAAAFAAGALALAACLGCALLWWLLSR